MKISEETQHNLLLAIVSVLFIRFSLGLTEAPETAPPEIIVP